MQSNALLAECIQMLSAFRSAYFYVKQSVLSALCVVWIRLVEYANDKGWLKDLAEFLAKDAAEIEMIDRAHTFSEVCSAFDKTMKKPGGLSLWALSANPHANLVHFSNNMRRDMKVQYPKSKYAVKVVELARDKNWLQDLAMHAANKKAAEDDEDEVDSDVPGMSGSLLVE